MQTGEFRHGLYQMITYPDFGFYQMMPHDHLRDRSGTPFTESEHGNWKFHLSIDPDDLPKAWDIVAAKLMNHTHAHIAKVTKPEVSERFANPNSIQAGKHITIYTFKAINPEVYKTLIQDIEESLAQNGIKAGPRSNADRIIPGGVYTGYRSDKDNNGGYIGSDTIQNLPRDQRHNPFNQPDPYIKFTIENRYQPKSKADNARDFNSEDWFEVTDRTGKVAKYFVLDDKSRTEQVAMHENLYNAGIDYEQKASSINGGCTVLSVKGEHNLKKLDTLLNIPQSPKSPTTPSTKGGFLQRMLGR